MRATKVVVITNPQRHWAGTQVLHADELLDLDQPVELDINGQAARAAKPVRSIKTIREALDAPRSRRHARRGHGLSVMKCRNFFFTL